MVGKGLINHSVICCGIIPIDVGICHKKKPDPQIFQDGSTTTVSVSINLLRWGCLVYAAASPCALQLPLSVYPSSTGSSPAE